MKIGELYRAKIVELLEKKFKENKNVVFINIEGVSAIQMDSLRRQLRAQESQLLVSKNRLIRIAAKEREGIEQFLQSNTALLFAPDESLPASCKVIFNLMDENPALKIKGAFIEGKAVGKEKVEAISKLPSKAVLQSMVVNAVAAPMVSLLNTFNQVISKFLLTLEEIKKSKEKKEKSSK